MALTKRQIKEDLMSQLDYAGKTGSFFEDQVNAYCELFTIQKKLFRDIRLKGVRVPVTTGNGFTTERINESVSMIPKVNSQMLKILNDLDLKAPTEDATDLL